MPLFTGVSVLFLVPSQPVGLEVSYINFSSLNVKWEPPLYPNGQITKYIVEYKRSSYSVWMESKDWCLREIFSTRPAQDKDSGTDANSNGEGMRAV